MRSLLARLTPLHSKYIYEQDVCETQIPLKQNFYASRSKAILYHYNSFYTFESWSRSYIKAYQLSIYTDVKGPVVQKLWPNIKLFTSIHRRKVKKNII